MHSFPLHDTPEALEAHGGDGGIVVPSVLTNVTDRLGGGRLASSPGKLLVKDRYDPYAPIRKEASKTTAGNLTGYGIELEVTDEDGTKRHELVGTVSPEYLLVPNADVKRIGDDLVRESGLSFYEERVAFDGRRYLRTLVVDESTVEQGIKDGIQPGVDDTFTFGMLFRNSYDGSVAAQASLFLLRKICVNGMVSTQYFASHRFRHTMENQNWEEEMERALSIIAHAPETLSRFIVAIETMRRHKMTDALLRQLRGGIIPRLPVTKWGEVMDHYLKSEEATVYGLLNAASNVLWHKDGATMANLSQNDYAVTNLLDWAVEHVN